MSSNNIDFARPDELQIFESLPGNFLLLSPQLIILGASDAYLEVTGKDRESITGQFLFDIFPQSPEWLPDGDGRIAYSLDQVLNTGTEHSLPAMRFDIPSKDNEGIEERYWKTTNKPVLDTDGNIRYIIHHTSDITQDVLKEKWLQEALETERQATAKARLLSEQMERLFHDIPAQIAIVSGEDLVYQYINPQYQRELLPGRDVLGLPLLAALPEIFGQPIWHVLQGVYRTGEPHIEKEMMVPLAPYKGGPVEEHYFNTVYHPLRNEKGEIYGLLSFKYEITEHVAARKKLEVSEACLVEAHLDLRESYEELQAVHEELQASNEELRATNEELRAAQESLGNLNAELEARIAERTKQLKDSFEEQQSLNEELAATNEELTDTQHALKKTLAGLTESEQRFQFMLNAIPQQVWTASPEGALDYVNKVVTDDFGYSAEEILGRGWQRFIHPEDLPASLKAWQLSLSEGIEYETEFRLLMKDGSYIWHIARALPFMQEGCITQWLGTNTNIQLQKNNEQKKDEFMSIASHELKTPLTSIKAFNQIMQRMEAPDRLKTFITKSADHIYRLEKLINDLLDVTRITAGKMLYDMQPFDFNAMLMDAIESVQLKSEKHQLILHYSENVIYTGDKLRLEQVLNNFLGNAIKYSPDASEVIINSKLEENSIVVSIQDFGIGIDETHLDKLFDRFYRVDNTAMRFEGLGLGLFISSEILKRHQGSFWIESTVGVGTTFYFRLPLEQKTEMAISNDDLYYHDNSISIVYNRTSKRLDVDWKGFQDFDSVQAGCLRMLRILKHQKADKVLNDNTHVTGTWSEAAEWVGKEWFPMMEKAGLRYFAWVYSPSAFSRMSAEKSVEVKMDGVMTGLFDNVPDAENWLKSIKA